MAELADVLEEEFDAIEDFLRQGESLLFLQGSSILYPVRGTNQEIASGNRRIAELLADRQRKKGKSDGR